MLLLHVLILWTCRLFLHTLTCVDTSTGRLLVNTLTCVDTSITGYLLIRWHVWIQVQVGYLLIRWYVWTQIHADYFLLVKHVCTHIRPYTLAYVNTDTISLLLTLACMEDICTIKLLPHTLQWRVGCTKLDIYVFIIITTSTDELLGIILPEFSASVVAGFIRHI